MLKSLRSRLLLSYLAVIVVALVLVAGTLFGFSTVSAVRYLPGLQRLAAISLTNQVDLLRLQQLGGSGDDVEQLLDGTSVAQDVRIIAADALSLRVVYDSAPNGAWLGHRITEVSEPRDLPFDAANNSIFGLYQSPDGDSWLVYAQPTLAFDRFIFLYAIPEPTPLSFFRDFFVNPLIGAGVIAFLLSILLALIITTSVARPLQRMAGAAEAIAEGDYDQALALEGPREVRRVANSFNSMARQVNATQQSQRDFVANVSHDLKTPITSIQGWSQALLDGTAVTPEEQQQAARIINSESERMARMVDDLLALARLSSGQLALTLEPVDVAQLVEDVAATLLPRAQEKQIELTVDVAPVPPVRGDADRLTQVITNLAANALTYTPPGGHVSLTLRTPEDDEVAIAVADDGPGIPAAELPRIFERFYQVDKSRTRVQEPGGHGLGLAIAKELVALHNGRIQVDSQEGRGSIFTVFLPAEAGPRP